MLTKRLAAARREKFADFNRRLEEMEGKYGACSKEHAVVQAELERASSEFKEFERKDIKYREDVKHSKQKVPRPAPCPAPSRLCRAAPMQLSWP